MVIPNIGQMMLLFAGYLIGLVAIRLWNSPEFRNPGGRKKQEEEALPEFRPRAKSPRSGVPRRPQ